MCERGWSAGRQQRLFVVIPVILAFAAAVTSAPAAAQAMQASHVPGSLMSAREGSRIATGMLRDEAARLCRMVFHSDDEVERSALVLTGLVAGATWDTVLVARFPADVPAAARASVVALPGVAPLIYWRGPLHGDELLHELVHARQAMLPDDAFDTLLVRLARRDAPAGFTPEIVEQATGSVMTSIVFALRSTRQDRAPQLVEHALVEHATMVDASARGALIRRADALAALLAGPEWEPARRALAHGLTSRQAAADDERGWAAWLRAFMLLEAEAYDAQARCATGTPLGD